MGYVDALFKAPRLPRTPLSPGAFISVSESLFFADHWGRSLTDFAPFPEREKVPFVQMAIPAPF